MRISVATGFAFFLSYLIPNPAISSTGYRLRRYFSTVLSSFRYTRETPEHSNELSARSDSHGCGRKYHPKKFATFRGPRISLRTVTEKYRKSLYPALLIAGFGLIFPAIAMGMEPHTDILKTRCLECHKTLPFKGASLEYKDSADSTCLRCHDLGRKGFSHPVGIRVKNPLPEDMPLSSDGKLMCITCHTFHSSFYIPALEKKLFLRRPVTGKTFCVSCHKDDPLINIK